MDAHMLESKLTENNVAGARENSGKVSEKKWPGWPGENVFRLLVPTQKIGIIIGRKGEFIKKICEESKARIKILDGPRGALERTVIISAKEEPEVSVSPAMIGLLKVHKRLIDGLDGDSTHGSSNYGNVVLTRLLVGTTQAGSLIGKQGSTIKFIQETSSSVVRVVDNLPPVALPGDRIVEIQGEPNGVHKALELVSTHLRKFLVDRGVLPLFDLQAPMRNQEIEHSLQPRQPWDYPQGFPQNVGGSNYGAASQYMPLRRHDNYFRAPDLFSLEKHHHGISAYGRDVPSMAHYLSTNQQSAPPMVAQVTRQMQISLSYADAVIGAAGTNISYIRRASGAAVTVQETRGVSGEMTVEIIGSTTQVQTAQQLIQNFIAGAAAPAAAVPSQSLMGSTDQGYGGAYPSHGMYTSNPATALYGGGLSYDSYYNY